MRKADRTCDRCGLFGFSRGGKGWRDLTRQVAHRPTPMQMKVHIYTFRNTTRILIFLCAFCVQDMIYSRSEGRIPMEVRVGGV